MSADDDEVTMKDAWSNTIYGPVSGDAKKLANEVKHQMDDTDATVHMNKMGIATHRHGGKGHGGKGGKGHGRMQDPIMSSLIGAEANKDDPLVAKGVPPRFDRIMQHLEEAGRLADFTDQVERTCRLGEPSQPSLDDLEARESGITAGIEALLSKVKAGKLFGKLKAGVKHHSNPEQELRTALTQAASKEDDAKIVQQAGTIAEHSIQKTLAAGMAMKPKKPEEPKKAEEPAPLPQVSGAVEEDDVEADAEKELHVPVERLRDHSVQALDQTLTQALQLYSQRHAHHKHLSVDEHKALSKQLRSIAAHMMNRLQERAAAPKPEPKAPPAKKASETAAAHTEKPPAQPAAVQEPVKSKTTAGPKPAEPPQPPAPGVTVPAKPLVEGTAVKQFVWHVLGNQEPQQAMTAAPTLADLLKKGVALFGGGRLMFDVHKK